MPGHFWADNEVLDVFGPQLGEHGFCAYMVLCRHATNGTGVCRISTRKLARQLGMSAGGAFNALATVLRLGLARQISRGDNANPGVYVLADVKALLNPDIAQLKFAGQGAHGVSAIAHPVNTGVHHVSAVLTPRARNKESKRLSQDSKTGRLNHSGVDLDSRKPEDKVSQLATDLQVQEIAALHPKIHDAFHLTNEVSNAIAEAVERDGRERVRAGTKSMADAVIRWPKEEMQFLPSAPRFFRESQYRKDPREWERKVDGKSVTPKNPPPPPNPADLKRRMLAEMND